MYTRKAYNISYMMYCTDTTTKLNNSISLLQVICDLETQANRRPL